MDRRAFTITAVFRCFRTTLSRSFYRGGSGICGQVAMTTRTRSGGATFGGGMRAHFGKTRANRRR